jgi:hypothetical protein
MREKAGVLLRVQAKRDQQEDYPRKREKDGKSGKSCKDCRFRIEDFGLKK